MRLALAQMDVVPGRPKKTLETMLSMIEEAKAKEADLVAFPEQVFGYLLGDLWNHDGFCSGLMRYNEDLAKASHGIAIAYGNIFLDKNLNTRVEDAGFHPNEDGRIRRYNAVYVIQNGKPVPRVKETNLLPPGVQPKTLLPNYRMFDDKRYFHSTIQIAQDFGANLKELLQPFLITTRDGKQVPIGFEICEDLWCEDYRTSGQALNPTKMLIENGAQYIVNISASPWTFGKHGARDRRVQFLKQESEDRFVPFLYVNCTGAQNNGKNLVTFDGGSTGYNREGLPVVLGNTSYRQEVMMVNTPDLEQQARTRSEPPKIAQKNEAIVRGIQYMKDLLGRENHPRYVIGLSGGIDSAVVAALIAQAVGSQRVLGVNMPTRYNSTKTRDAAAHVARKLGIAYEIIPIEDLVAVNERILAQVNADGSGRPLSSLLRENIPAKIRGTSILSNLAQKYGAIFTNNGNKLEVALGYATLYGDVGGALAPIADLTKTEVVEMARYLNKKIFRDEIIPESVIPDELWRFRDDQIQPSAELKEKQVDPMKFGYHCALLEAMTDYKKKSTVDIMRFYLEGTIEKNLGISTALLQRWNIMDPQEFVQDLEWFDRCIRLNVFKRVQSPPIIITSKSAYGYDIRESILPYETSREHDELKAKILQGMKHYEPRGAA